MPYSEFYELKERIGAVLSTDYFSKHGGYKISSLYFDDLFDSNYTDTVSGNPYRKKYRVRIYNDSLETIKLEVKTKYYSRISKESCTISVDELHRLMNGDLIEWGATRNDPRTAFNEEICSNGLRPKVIVTYDRTAYVYEQGNTRITFDSGVRASNLIDHFGNQDLIHDSLVDSNYVLEVKYDEFIPDYLLQVLEQYSTWKTSFSKYGSCREAYLGGA